jgi:CRISPR-associated protein Cas8a1/Csx13
MERQRKRQPGVSVERLWFQAVRYQRGKLMKLIAEDDMWDTEAEKLFVEAFWEALDSLYAQEAAATERGGSRSVTERFEDFNDEVRRRLTQAKTRTLLRTALADLFARAGRQKTIRAHPAAVWRLIDHPDQWRKGRDLALLALASHRKKEDRESAAQKGA